MIWYCIDVVCIFYLFHITHCFFNISLIIYLSILSVKIYMFNVYLLFTVRYISPFSLCCRITNRIYGCVCVSIIVEMYADVSTTQPLFSTFRNYLCFATLCSNLTKMCAVSRCGDNICAGGYCSRRLSLLLILSRW